MARPSGTTGQAKVLSSGEFKRVLAVANASSNKLKASRDCAILHTSFYLGLRVSEIAKLKIGDVLDSQGNLKDVIKLWASITKGNKHRDVYLSSKALKKSLTAYLELRKSTQGGLKKDESLFKSQKGGMFSSNSLGQLVKKIFKDAGLDGCSSHSGRRTMITRLAEQGIDIKSISVIAGHANISTTSRYIETNPARLSKILENVALD